MKNLLLILFMATSILVVPLISAHADQNAVIFIEMEHADSDEQTQEEVITVKCFNYYLAKKYNKIYWLVNTDATKDNFLETMQKAVNESTVLDLYIVAHGGMQYLWGHFKDRIYVDDIISLKDYANMDRLRFVYIGSCHAWDLADEFIEAGADSVIGSIQQQDNFPFLPVFLYNFVIRGYTLKYAVKISSVPILDNFKIQGDDSIRFKSK